ncbi:MAG: carbonic anhydrase [Propionibacteriaceae bacterium]|nr:carbonic anhydrase [Propionibacteriaceae bacterium]
MSFDDLLEANRDYAQDFAHGGFDGIARAGVAILTCMDSRIEPLEMVGLHIGDVKILRSPGGRVSTSMMTGLALSVQLLNVERIMIVPHTKCAMADGTDEDIREVISERSGLDTTWLEFGTTPDQVKRLHHDVRAIRNHPLVKDRAEVGGFMYDVDTGLLEQLV